MDFSYPSRALARTVAASRISRAPAESGRLPGAFVAVTLAVGTGIGLPILGIALAGLARVSPYSDPFLNAEDAAPDWFSNWTSERQTIPEIQQESLELLLWTTITLVLLLLGTTLINLMSILLSRSSTLRHEYAMRTAVGASPSQLAKDRLREWGRIIPVGVFIGLLIAFPAAVLLGSSWPVGDPFWEGFGAESLVLLGVLAFLLAVTCIAWIAPSRIARKSDLYRHLTTGRRATASLGERSLNSMLAIIQMAAAIVLIVIAGILLRAFASSAQEPRAIGYDFRDTLALRVDLPAGEYSDPSRRSAFFEEVERRILAVPGTVAAAVGTTGVGVGLGTIDHVRTICAECFIGTMLRTINEGEARVHSISPGFLDSLGASIRRGREFDLSDYTAGEKTAVINRTFANRLFPNGDPLGKRLMLGRRDGEWYTVIGIVDDIRAQGIGSPGEFVPELYLSLLQHPPVTADVMIRTTAASMTHLPAVQSAIRTLEPNVEISDAMMLEKLIARYRSPLRWFAYLFGAISAGLIVLALSGLYTVMSSNVRQRTREIGIRITLGATRRDIHRLILGHSLRLTGIGAWIGLISLSGIARLIQMKYSGVKLWDPLLFSATTALLVAVSLAASYRAARWATDVDPGTALREN